MQDDLRWQHAMTRRSLLGAMATSVVAASSSGCFAAGPGDDPADILFENVSVVPMTVEGVQPNQAVAVTGGKVSAVVPQAQSRAIRAVRRIDCKGLHLMPALSDLHVHVEGEPERDFALFLANGITSVRNMSARTFDHLRIRQLVEAGRLDGPRYLVSGPSITERNMAAVADVAPMLDRHVSSRYDLVKVHGTLAPEVYDALIDGAKARGLKVSGHVQQGRPLAASLRMDSIEHAEEFLNVPGRPALENPQSAVAVAGEVAAAGTYVLPSLVVFDAISAYLDDRRLAGLATRPEIRYLPSAQRQQWLDPATNLYRRSIRKPERIASLAAAVPVLQRFVRRLQDAGVPLLLGTDAAGALVPGFSLHDELALLVQSGLTPYQALRTGTVNAARFLGESQVAGSIAPGMRADLILVDGNPLADVASARRVRGVYGRGRWRDSAALAGLLDGAKNRASPEKSPYLL